MRKWLLGVVLVLASAGCLVQDLNLEGKACSTTHPCAEGYQCVSGQCLLPEHISATDGGAHCDGGAPDGGCP